MPRRYPKYLREEAVKRYLAGKRAADVAAEIGCATATIYEWVCKHWTEERSTHERQEV